ncbi:serine/threonine-protein kinase [Trujillonella endophytica]|uniref:non-specific serine/threonine protein kinase n=1 Tax=Trujillonella endophytica TaxID=673521 RepID=A0A1H8THY5_9ACTN|nr:serine/threonine-protein kinase [Trujillella endophytica]SEO90729.1 serine/threonine protein kinase [Trujillella endophytica]
MTPRQFGPYELVELLGVGGMGEVWRARDTRRDRWVALKVLPETLNGDREFAGRFRRESHVAARLREPHVIPIHDYGEIDGRLYIDMRLVDGHDLGRMLMDGPLDPARAIGLLSQVADALQAAHDDGLVHRDVKPSNVIVTASDFVYVVDFGIARSVGSTSTSLTMTGATVGTLDYMAPERFTNQPLDGRVDVYSLACVLSECLTAKRPFRGEDLPSLLYAHLYTDPPRPSELVAGVPAPLDEVVARGMAKRPEDRYSTPGELVAAARAALSGVPAPPPAPETARAPAAVPPVPAVAPAALGVVSAGGHNSTDQLPAPGPPPSAGPFPPATPPPPPGAFVPPPAPRRRRRGRGRAVAAALVALLLVAAALTVWLWPRDDDPPAADAGSGGATAGPSEPARGSREPQQAPPGPDVRPSIAVPTAVGEPIPVPPTPGYLAVAPNGRYAYIAHRDAGVVSVLDTTSLEVNATIPIDAGPPQFITFSPSGDRAYVTVYNADYTENYVVFVDTASNEVTATVEVGLRPFAPETSPDGSLLYIPLHNEGRVEVLDTATAREIDSYDVPPNPHWIAINDAGTVAYTANHESDVLSVLDLTDGGRVIGTIPAGDSPHSVAVSPDGSRVAVVAFDSSDVHVVDTATNALVASGPVGSHPQDVTWAPDGARFYTADVEGGTMSVVTADTLTVTARVPAGPTPTSVGVSPDGSRAYVTDLNGATVRVFDLTG